MIGKKVQKKKKGFLRVSAKNRKTAAAAALMAGLILGLGIVTGRAAVASVGAQVSADPGTVSCSLEPSGEEGICRLSVRSEIKQSCEVCLSLSEEGSENWPEGVTAELYSLNGEALIGRTSDGEFGTVARVYPGNSVISFFIRLYEEDGSPADESGLTACAELRPQTIRQRRSLENR